jgi:hypothetical protein
LIFVALLVRFARLRKSPRKQKARLPKQAGLFMNQRNFNLPP